MSSFGGKRTVSPVKATDLKKEIVKKNKELKAKNSSLSSSNKQISQDLKSKEKLLKSIDNNIFDRQIALDKIDLDINKKKKTIKEKNVLLKEVIESLSKQMSERFLLEEEIQIDTDKVEALKADIGGLQSTIKSLEHEEDKFADLQEYISKAKKTASRAKSDAKKAVSNCLSKKVKAAEQIASLQEEIKQIQVIKNDMDEQIEALVKEYRSTIKAQDQVLEKRSEELRYIENKKEDMETAISNYKTEIRDLQSIVSDKKSALKKIRGEYDKFKLQAFDEMARLKMRGKIENIKKAGLGDIFESSKK